MATKKEDNGKKDVLNTRNLESYSLGGALQQVKTLLKGMSPDECPSILLLGVPGIGKTEGLRQVCKELGYPVEVRHLSQVHPLDMAGIIVKDDKMQFAVSPLTQALEALGKGKKVCMLDELDRLQPIGQPPIFQFLLERKINGFHSPNTYVVAAGNGNTCSYTFDLDAAMASRLAIMRIEPDVDEWLTWGATANIHHTILIAIVNGGIDLLNQHGTGEMKSAMKIADPRAWHNLSNALRGGFDPNNAAIFVGQNAAKAYRIWLNFDSDYSVQIKQVLAGKALAGEHAPATLFGIYMAGAAQCNDWKAGERYFPGAVEALGGERSYVVGRIMQLRMGGMEEVRKSAKLLKLHETVYGEYAGTGDKK